MATQQSVTYIPFGSFIRPSSDAQYKRLQTMKSTEYIRREGMKPEYNGREVLQSPEYIRREVTSFDVKPLYPRPSFPRQAQVLPVCANENIALQDPQSVRFSHQGQPRPEMYTSQGFARQANCYVQDENLGVYIHRQNSFIDVSKMTHHDHSSSGKTTGTDVAARSRTRSHDEVDAAMTLATCLKIENKN